MHSFGSTGIEAIWSKKISAERNPGLDWKLKMFIENPILVPEGNEIFEMNDRTLRMDFGVYRQQVNRQQYRQWRRIGIRNKRNFYDRSFMKQDT